MHWHEAEKQIRECLCVGTDLNTSSSTYRAVKACNDSSRSYDYGGEQGFRVRIGRGDTAQVFIPWSMLRACFEQLTAEQGYNSKFFRAEYPKQAKDHPCHIHVVGMILVVARLARPDGGTYRPLRTPRAAMN